MTRGKKHNRQRQQQRPPGSAPHNQSIPIIREGSIQPYVQGSPIQPYVQGNPVQPYGQGNPFQPYGQGNPVQPYVQGSSNQPGFAVGSRFSPTFGAPWDGRQQFAFSPPIGQFSQLQHPRNLPDHLRGQESRAFYSTAPPDAKAGHGLQSSWNEEAQSIHWHQGGQPSSSGVSSNNERLSAEIGGFQTLQINPSSSTTGIRGKQKEDARGKETISKLDKRATEVYDNLLNERKGVTVKKVLQGMLSAIGSVSLDSLGLHIQDIPCLRQLSSLEAKVNASIQAYVVGRKILSLHDLICDICQDEGVEEFEELGLGPPLFHPLIIKYFCPPDTTNYCKITALEVVLYLAKYLGNRKDHSLATKQVDLQQFLEYLVKSRGVSTVQHLCVRIQSLGMFIGPIRRAINKELNMLLSFKSKRGNQTIKHEGVSLSERVNHFFASAQKEGEASQNQLELESLKSTNSTDSENQKVQKKERDHKLGFTSSVNGNVVVESHQKENGGHVLGFSNCPYPSQTEEFIRARKHGSSEPNNPYIMSEMELAEFVAAWKGPCHNSSISEVIGMMLQEAPNTKFQKRSKKKAKKQAALFTSYPAIGLLNIAVLSMKAGHWNSMYDHFQEVTAADLWTEKEAQTAKISAAIEVDYTPKSSRSQFQKSTDVDSEELLSALVEHFDQFFFANNKKTDEKRMWEMLRWALECEKHVANLYSDKIFPELGFEGMVEFLEHHLEHLPRRMVNSLRLNSSSSPDHEAVDLQQRLLNFVTQAVRAFGSGVSLDKIALQLSKHFGMQFVEKVGMEFLDGILKNVLEGESSALCDSLLFAGALLSKGCNFNYMNSDEGFPIGKGLDSHTRVTAQVNVGSLGSISSLDAWTCLLRAPTLCDLKDWSKWESVFAPSLGPFLDWFEHEGSGSRLCVLMTCSGKFLRIEGMATAEDFLMVTARGTGKEIAEKLLSLVSVYGGVSNVPKSLLKSYAKKALDVRIGLFGPITNDNPALDGKILKASAGQQCATESWKRKQIDALQDDVGSSKKFKPSNNLSFENSKEKYPDSAISDVFVQAGSTRTTVENSAGIVPSEGAVNCILDCLFTLPSEFRVFGGEILLPAVFSLMSLSPTTFLNACRTIEHRLMLHGIGLEMDIPEWVTDYQCHVIRPPSGDKNVNRGNNISEHGHEALIKTHEIEEVCTENNLQTRVVTMDVLNPNSLHEGKNPELETSDMDSMTEISHLETYVVMKSKFETSGEVSCDTTEKMEKEAEEVIMSIRRNEFGIEQEVESSDDNLLARQHARMGRALNCLSRNLYSEDCHFVLELVQNADDNSYAAGVEATLVFNVQQGHVVVLNNEIGFTAANMRALCDVGNSTKSGSNAGYIGHKGIGFKAVFRVTDSPEIHSNGFHVKFDSSQGDIGFILPTLAPAPSDDHVLKSYFSETLSNKTTRKSKASWNTRIDLPLRPSLSNGMGMNTVTAMFNDLHPTLLLFLHNVRKIVVRNDVTKSLCYMERLDVGDNLVKLVNGESTSTWLVVRKKLEASVYRAGITSTEIALAFPLNELHDGSFDACMGKQKVFAFLPLRSYGLRFIVQADFILPSSREEVDHDSAWNQWLLSEVPGVFLEAAHSFRMLPDVKALANIITSYMKFVPMENEVVGFFSSLPRMILSGLRSIPCLPIQNGEGACALPCTLLKGWDEAVRSFLPDSLLRDHLGMHYLDKEVSLSDALALSLGVQVYGLETLLSLMKSVCSQRGCLESLGLNWVHCWVIEWQKCSSVGQKGLDKFVHKDAELYMLKELQSLPFIALSNGSFTSPIEGLLWFTNSVANEEASPHTQMFSLLYSDLRTVHPEILQCSTECGDTHAKSLTAISSESVKFFWVKLGVRELSAHEIIKIHILPKILEQDCIKNDKLLAVQYLAFIMLHFYSDCKDCIVEKDIILKKLQKDCIILTSEGLIRPDRSFIHFPIELGNKINMMEIFDGVKLFWPEVDPVYLQFLPSQSSNFCRSFFEGLGVTDFLQVVPVEKTICDKSTSIWKDCSWELAYDSKEWIIQDWECSEISSILEALCRSPRKHDQCSKLLMALDMLWNDQYYQFSRSTYRSSDGNDQELGVTESTFVLTMRQFSWIKSSQDRELHVPTELFHCCDAIEKLLGNQASYAMPRIQSMGLVEALGLRTSVSLNDVYEVLKGWNGSGKNCEASISQMTRIYSFLCNEIGAQEEAVFKLFSSCRCVFVPDMLNMDSEKCTQGKMYKLTEVSWSDATGSLDVLDSHASKTTCQIDLGYTFALKPLSKVYPSLHAFFIGVLHIKGQPDFGGYLSILLNISALFSPDEAKKQILGIFSALSSEVESGRVSAEDLAKWKGKLLSTGARVFPTMQDRWVSLNEEGKLICWCDNEDLLKDCNGLKNRINFVFINNGLQMGKAESNKDNSSNIAILMSSLGVPRFSELVEPEVIAYGSHNNDQLKELLWWSFPFAQRYVKQFQPQLYEMLKRTKVEDRLRKLEILVVDQLFIRYNLRSSFAWSSERRNQRCLLQDDIFYVSLANVGNYSALYLELSRLFFSKKADSHLANILHLITLMAESGSSESSIETFICSGQGIPPLPDGEPSWAGDLKPEVFTSDTTRMSASAYLERHRVRREAQQKVFQSNLSGNVWPPCSYPPRPVKLQELEEGDPQYENRKTIRRPFEDSIARTENIPPLSVICADMVLDDSHPSFLDKGDIPSKSVSDSKQQQSDFVPPEHFSKPCSNLEAADFNCIKSELLKTLNVDDENKVCSMAKFAERDRLNLISEMTDQQLKAIGHSGESIVFWHLVARHGISHVRWLNENVESGAPFDIIINEGTAEEEFVEVKTTRSLDKDWFEISVHEWEFAKKKGSRFTIFRVFLGGSDPSSVRLLPLADPARLCHDRVVQLAVVLPHNQLLDLQHHK